MLHTCVPEIQLLAQGRLEMAAVSLLQTAAVALGLVALGFFVFFGAYYVRNRRIALSRHEDLGGDTAQSAPSTSQEYDATRRGG